MNTFNILYIDNKPDSKLIVNYLLDLGYNVRWVSQLNEAKTQILLERFDLLITEIDLEDGNGLDFIKEISKDNSIKVIVLSSNKDPEQLIKALELRIEKYLSKPVDLEELKSTIFKSLIVDNSIDDTKIKELIELENGFTYNILKQQLHSDNDENIFLTQQELSLIQTLILQKGYPCSYEMLQSSIGLSGEHTTIETLRTVVKKIRKKTYENIIENLSGIGYKIRIPSCNTQEDISSLVNIVPIDKKILIVKGNENKNKKLQKKLEQFGFICEQVFLLQEAKEALKYETFDYVVLELQLPDGDGAEIIRDEQNIENNKFIVLSNTEDMHYKEYLYFKGIIDYIEKRDDTDYIAYSIYQTILKIESNFVHNNVLLIENSKKIAEQIKDILLPRNYQVDITSNFEKVIDLIHHKAYTLIILDLELEGINSLDFLMALKNEVDKTLPIIMLSASKRSYSVVRECYVKGAVECLRKPIFAEEFILKVDQWTDYYKQTLELKDNQHFLNSYKNLVDKTVIVSKTDIHGVITYVNDIFCEISGYSREELIGHPHSIVRHPDMKKAVFKEMWHTISKEKKIWSGILKNRKKDGTFYILSAYTMPILDHNNNIIEYMALRNDITNIKK